MDTATIVAILQRIVDFVCGIAVGMFLQALRMYLMARKEAKRRRYGG